MFVASHRLVSLVEVEVEMGKVGRWTSRHVLKWRKQNVTPIVVGKESHGEFNVDLGVEHFSF